MIGNMRRNGVCKGGWRGRKGGGERKGERERERERESENVAGKGWDSTSFVCVSPTEVSMLQLGLGATVSLHPTRTPCTPHVQHVAS